MRLLFAFILVGMLCPAVFAQNTYHVSKRGSDNDSGDRKEPFLTIQKAADVAQPGDKIVVHEGTYRERITPPRGGSSDTNRIVYKAAEDEDVTIKGSEVVDGWDKFKSNVWKLSLSHTFFENYNPYEDKIEGDWFDDRGRIHHTGEVYLNGKSLWESATLEGVLNPNPKKDKFDPEGSTYTWYTESDDENTYIYANFHGANPNEEIVEINVRRSIFYPDTTGIDFITVKGFNMRQAATQWAPPTAEQIGLIGTFWSKGWIIENNQISDSKCTGITLGKDRETGHNVWTKNPDIGGSTHYNRVIDRAIKKGWSKETVGSHIVRNNEIYNCEQAGIVGSMGAINSTIENNDIYNIWTKRQFGGSEMAGIKLHAPIDVILRGNRLANCGRGMWLDWMAQGTRVTGNLFYNNTTDDLFFEVNHGPYPVDNNILLSEMSFRDWSKGGAVVHNLIAGKVELEPHLRETPYFKPHSTDLVGREPTVGGDNRFYNNIFVGGVEETKNEYSGLLTSPGLKVYNKAELPMYVNRNVYLNGAYQYKEEEHFLELDYDPNLNINEKQEGVYLSMKFDEQIEEFKNELITSEFLGKAKLPKQGYVDPDGSSLTIDKDYFGKDRSESNPTAGPFENPDYGKIRLKVW